MSKRRVVVTGLGMLSPVGKTAESSWQALLQGQSGIRAIEHFDPADYPVKFAGTIDDFNAEDYGLSRKEQRKMDLFIQYGIAAGQMALEDSRLEITEQNARRVGVAVGSGIGGIGLIEYHHSAMLKGGPRKIGPFFVPSTIINMAAGHLSIVNGLRGPNIAVSTACTTGTHCIGLAARMIAYGDADAMLAGGSEKASTELGIGGFAAAKALSTRNDEPQKASRPWDQGRDGFVLGDGAGVVMIEEYEHAKARGATIYAELIGFGMSGDANHITAPNGIGAREAMENALYDAKIDPCQVGYVNAHGTSTPLGDMVELAAVKEVFGEHATSKLMVSSTKSMTGHLLGAAGAIEAIITVQALRDQIVPPTINLDNPEADCDVDLVPHVAKKAEFDYALSNSFGFGGTNGSLIFKRV